MSDAGTTHARQHPDTDLQCLNCGYSLRGLTTLRCPECGGAFDWDTVREQTRLRLDRVLFEHQWRRRPTLMRCNQREKLQ